jgi:hypothetical protein
MSYKPLTCTECGETSDVLCDGDNPHFCPECRSVDTMTEIEEEGS